MKPCYESNSAVYEFMLEGSRPYIILCFNVHIAVEYLNRNVSIGQ